MEIRESDFLLEFEEKCNRFTLSLLYVKNAKKEDKRSEEFKIYGYGMTLESCLSVIINYRLNKKQDTFSLKQYLVEYKAQLKILSEILKP